MRFDLLPWGIRNAPDYTKKCTILGSYGNGKLFESEKTGEKSRVSDLVSISDEARKRFKTEGYGNNFPNADDAIEN
jgi:hypothetical protein